MKVGPVVEKQKASLSGNARSVAKDEDVFQQAYEQMTAEEKKMYRIFQLALPEGADLEAVRQALERDRRVQFVSYDYLADLHVASNDPNYANLWAMPKIEAECAWDISQGENIVVAVVDTGVDYTHPDLVNNMWKDGFGNHGYDFSDGDSDAMDYYGHGTHVAGTIAAELNNAVGVVGVAPKAKIMAVKIFPNAYSSVIAQAWTWAVDNGAKVFNNSWGYGSPYPSDPVLEAAADYVHSKGGVLIMSAGNNDDVTANYSPQNYSKTISVAATDQTDQRAWFSNYGPGTDVAAPGVYIQSTLMGGGYGYMQGTSMASPHVAGQAALLLAQNPGLTFEEVRDIIVNTADAITTDKPIGSGRINLCNGLKVEASCVAFTASGESHISQGADLQLSYPDTYSNEGSAWDGTQFVAPATGIYHFVVSFVRDALKHGGTLDDVRIFLKHNNVVVGKAWSSEGAGWAGSGSFAASLSLAKGDVITTFVSSDKGDKRHVSYYTLCGHMVCKG
ncbi:MAG: S8 family serine peptidase [Saprospirales bacterium]|nr:S8 family serine peptidase [Saprospirales bacterium]